MNEETLGLSITPPDQSLHHPVLRNTLLLTVAQIVSVPLSIIGNIANARYLGPAAFGYMYIGSTFNAFGFLAVDWGQSGALPGLVATDRSRAGRLLGTSLVWRVLSALVVYAVLDVLCRLLGYGPGVRVVVGLSFVAYAISSLTSACQSVIVGFERADVAAYRQILEQLLMLLIVVPILVLGGGVNAALVGYAIVTAILLVYVWRALPSTGVGRLSVDVGTLQTLLRTGTPFIALNMAMLLQPTIDAVFLSKLASSDVVGWYSAARRLIGFLIFPATALIGALYPTLCRLYASDMPAFRETVIGSLRWTSVLVIPVALGTALYADIGVALYDRKTFLPAADNLRILSVFLFLLYFTMPLSVCILAAGRQRIWAVVQASCVVVSLVLDPILVPWFQRRTGNGGMGLCVAGVVSECIVLGGGIALAPKGIFVRSFWRSLVPAVASGILMVVVARALRPLTSFVAAPLAVGAYVGCLWTMGGIDRSFVAAIGRVVGGKLSRLKDRSQEDPPS